MNRRDVVIKRYELITIPFIRNSFFGHVYLQFTPIVYSEQWENITQI